MLSIEGNIVNIDKTFRGRIEIGDDGLILRVGQPTGVADVVLKEELIFPGFIDLHIHAREDVSQKWNYKEDFNSASLAGINGGVIAFADMPNNPLPPTDEFSYSAKEKLAKKSEVDVLLYAGVGQNTKPLDKAVPYKVFMGQSVGELFFESQNELEKTLENYVGQSVSFHCEDPEILEQNKNQSTHGQRRPPEAETTAVDFALRLIKKYNLEGKICHCSTIGALAGIITAKKQGVKVTVEVAPHHLYFDELMINEQNRKMFQVNPPIRQSPENRLALIEALKKGEIDYLATDHAPHTLAEKEQGISGLPHLDTYGCFVTWLMKEHQFSFQDIARVCSFNPGKFFSRFSKIQYGKIEVGYIGSLTILDINKPVKIEKRMLKTKCNWSPFEGITFPGSVKMTIIKGKICKQS